MEVFGVPVTGPSVVIAGGGLLAFWEFIGSKVPWASLLQKLTAFITRKKTEANVSVAPATPPAFQSDPDPAYDVMHAIRELHQHAADNDAHAKISAVEADYWQKLKPVVVPTLPVDSAK